MSTLRALVDTHYEQFNTQDYSRIAEVFSPDVQTTMPGSDTVRGFEPFLAYSKSFYQAFPDARIHFGSAVEEGDTIIVEGHFTGTHTEPMVSPAGTIPPTGRNIDFPFCDVFQARDGRIVAHRVYFDQVTFLTQLGLMPAPAAG